MPNIENIDNSLSPDVQLQNWLTEIENRWNDIPEFTLDKEKFKHLAVICDGNRRSAQDRGLDPWFGHRAGIEVIRGIMEASKKWGIKYLTFWTWSTENWKRDNMQVSFVMDLAARYLSDQEAIDRLLADRVRFRHLGRKDRLPVDVLTAIDNLEDKTKDFSDLSVNLALDYGGLDELGRAVSSISQKVSEGIITFNQISNNPNLILGYLDTSGQPVPDLVVRSGNIEGEVPHTSGFMPIQTAYSGWKFLPDLFPDLTPQILQNSIEDFLGYERRQGK